jgi:hypothetical protein
MTRNQPAWSSHLAKTSTTRPLDIRAALAGIANLPRALASPHADLACVEAR